MNVLVYSGPGVSQTSLDATLSTLKSLLGSNFAVQTVSPKALESEPWTVGCALLVIPGGRDLPYLASLERAIPKIVGYVKAGGSYLGICAGAYFASGRIEWEIGTPLEVQGERPLKFFPGLSKGCMYPGFQYDTEIGARTVSITTCDGEKVIEGLYYNGGGEFVVQESMKDVEPLAYYNDPHGSRSIAGVSCTFGIGKAVLWHIHPEYPITGELVVAAAARSTEGPAVAHLPQLETQRQILFCDTMRILGLSFPSLANHRDPPTHPLPQHIYATERALSILEALEGALESIQNEHGIVDDTIDSFKVHKASAEFNPRDIPLEFDGIQHVVFHQEYPPNDDAASLFSISSYFDALREARKTRGSCTPSAPLQCELGDILLYGEAISSTQTLLERNIKTLEVLPVPLLSLATYQLSGRGRGSNVWVSPLGCLQWSLLLRPPPQFPTGKLVFIQYLVGLAVVEACRDVMGKLGDSVVLKWPNDIYAKVKILRGEEMKKIGGILVNTVFMAGGVRIIVGCGVNVLNDPPIFSLSQLHPGGSKAIPKLTMENMAATIMVIFGRMWNEFIAAGSFEPFVDLYLDRWIHSDQLVTLESVHPPVRARIVGITPDYGLLRTIPETYKAGGPEFIDLQPDGNSFDMMAGLIRTKK
ncbi:biotin holocarboxylase synthetase [Serendipita sp. 398]|nr:biotin holocarboxylase synthetase [Serendipita sp. 398]